MHIVIEMSDLEYEKARLDGVSACQMIRRGTLLPKGHGRLIDGDLLKENYPHDTDWEYPVNTNQYVCDTIDAMATIIEADKV